MAKNITDLPALLPDDAPLPARYEAAKQALAECEKLDECKNWADKMSALASYAKQAGDKGLLYMAQRIRARATRRVGELLLAIESAKGAHLKSETFQGVTKSRGAPTFLEREEPLNAGTIHSREDDRGAPTILTRAAAARGAGLSKDQQNTAIRVARIPEADFEAEVESGRPASIERLAMLGTQPRVLPPDYLGGRSPELFNTIMHFGGALESYAEAMRAVDIDAILPHVTEKEIAEILGAVHAVQPTHDRIMEVLGQ